MREGGSFPGKVGSSGPGASSWGSRPRGRALDGPPAPPLVALPLPSTVTHLLTFCSCLLPSLPEPGFLEGRGRARFCSPFVEPWDPRAHAPHSCTEGPFPASPHVPAQCACSPPGVRSPVGPCGLGGLEAVSAGGWAHRRPAGEASLALHQLIKTLPRTHFPTRSSPPAPTPPLFTVVK